MNIAMIPTAAHKKDLLIIFFAFDGITFLKKRKICKKYKRAHSKAPRVPTVIPNSNGFR